MREMNANVRDSLRGDTYAARQVIDDALLRAVHDVNRSFLVGASALLAGAGESHRLGHAAEVLALPPALRLVAGECPYTLFDLRFADGAFWRSVAAETRPAAALAPAGAAFARAAVVLAWHLSRTGDLAAPIALGMSPAVAEVWRALPVPALEHVAATALPHLTVRWATHRRFWPSLARALTTGNRGLLGEVRVLGMQLLAADGVRAESGS